MKYSGGENRGTKEGNTRGALTRDNKVDGTRVHLLWPGERRGGDVDRGEGLVGEINEYKG